MFTFKLNFLAMFFVKFLLISNMKILLIGHSVHDFITLPDKRIIEQPGGIFYSASAAFNLFGNTIKIKLLTEISDESYYLFEEVYSVVEQLFIQNERIPKIHLTVYQDKERDEEYENFLGSLPFEESYLNDVQGVYVNMITGFDLNLLQVQNIKSRFSGIKYIDIHSLARTIDNKNRRIFSPIQNCKEWLSCFDIVQANQTEARMIYDSNNENQIADFVFRTGVKIFIITKGRIGVSLFYKENDVIKKIIGKPPIVEDKNNVGCGDVFGVVFFTAFVMFNNIFTALNYALAASSAAAGFNSLKDFQKFKSNVELRLP